MFVVGTQNILKNNVVNPPILETTGLNLLEIFVKVFFCRPDPRSHNLGPPSSRTHPSQSEEAGPVVVWETFQLREVHTTVHGCELTNRHS